MISGHGGQLLAVFSTPASAPQTLPSPLLPTRPKRRKVISEGGRGEEEGGVAIGNGVSTPPHRRLRGATTLPFWLFSSCLGGSSGIAKDNSNNNQQ